MDPSRVSRILKDWDAVANEARRPVAPPHRIVVRSHLSSGATLGGASLVVVALAMTVFLMSGKGPPGSVGGLPSPPPSRTDAATRTSEPSSSVAPSPSSLPSSTPFAIGTAQPGDATTATELVSRYEAALVADRWQTAWALLAPEQQVHWGSYGAFVADRSAAFRSVAGRYTIKPPVHDLATIRFWAVLDYPAPPLWPVMPDYDRAFVVEVDYPLIAQYNAFDVLLAAPDMSGLWFIWQLR